MRIIKTAALIICILLCLQSCAVVVRYDKPKDTYPVDTVETVYHDDNAIYDTTPVSDIRNKAEDDLYKLNTQDAGGIRLVIASTDDRFLKGDGTETSLTSDRINRISKIETKLHASLSIEEYSEDDLISKLSSSLKKGEYFADVIAVPYRLLGSLVSNGLIRSVRSTPRFDLSAEYFDAEDLSAYTAGHNVYGVSGEAVFEPEYIYGIYFNKALAENLGLDVYSLVKSGEWTLQKYAECLSKVNSGVEPVVFDSKLPYKRALMFGAGFNSVENPLDSTPYATMYSEEFKDAVSVISSIENTEGVQDPQYMFLTGSALFYIGTLDKASEMASSGVVWGLLPFPKQTKAAAYSSYVSDDATVLCIPYNAPDTELSGDIIESLFVSSYGYMKYDYIYQNINHTLRDNESINSLYSLINNENRDFSVAFSSGYKTIKSLTLDNYDLLLTSKMTYSEYHKTQSELDNELKKLFAANNK